MQKKKKNLFFFILHFFSLFSPVSDYLLHFKVMALNANEFIPGPIPVSLFGMVISGVEQTMCNKRD